MSGGLIQFVNAGPYPVRTGNTVRLLVDGVPAFRRICAAVAAATTSVWLTVTFLWADFEFPDGEGTLFDILDKVAKRNVDVRLICWRPEGETLIWRKHAFWGSAEQRAFLTSRQPGVKIRWDAAQPGFCQHQKSWLIDAGTDSSLAFVGGINLNPHSLASPGHYGEGQNHDAYLELTGPAVADVHHNFVQRWNEASEDSWGTGSKASLPFPTKFPAATGGVTVQVQRTAHAAGERTIFLQYLMAIEAARRTIYIENQYLQVTEIIAALRRALERDVHVILVMPAVPYERRNPLNVRSDLGAFRHFSLCGLAGLGDDGIRKPVYVHAKLMLVDDEWGTVGSCNLHQYSLFGNSELNVAFQDDALVRSLRTELFREHLQKDTSTLSDLEACRLFRRIAGENRNKQINGDPAWQGIAFQMDMANYQG